MLKTEIKFIALYIITYLPFFHPYASTILIFIFAEYTTLHNISIMNLRSLYSLIRLPKAYIDYNSSFTT